jgi:RNA polymerase sigma-70 factor, ECF subfamily
MVEDLGALDDTLVRRCVSGERAAWRTLHARYYRTMAAFLLRLGLGPNELEDACQEVFLRAFRYLPGFRGDAELKTWLYKLCVTEARTARRRAWVSRNVLRRVRSEPPPALVTGLDLTEQEALRLAQRGLEALKQHERLVFVLYELEGLSGKQVAQIAGCPENTVWRRLHYARRAFCAVVGEGSLEPKRASGGDS